MTDPALERLVSAVADAKRDDPLAPVTVIVASNLAGRSVGWRLAEGLGGGRRAIAGLRITTAARLAESVAAVRLHPRRPLLPSILAAAWRAELEAAAATRQGWEFAGVWDHPATVNALARVYRDLREVPDGQLSLEPLGPVTAESARLCTAVRQQLVPDWYDQQDLFADATELASSDPSAFAEFGKFVEFLVEDEPLSARNFLDVLKSRVGWVTIHADTPRLADRVLHASDSDDEVRVVVREVVAALKGDQKARRLAILYTRPDPYVRIIHAHLTAAGIEFNGRGGLPVAEMASSRAFLGMLSLLEREFPRLRLFEVLSTWPTRQFASGDPIRTVIWERLSREANIAGGESVESGWVRRLDDLAARQRTLALTAQDRHRDAIDRKLEDVQQLCAFVITLERRLRDLDEAASWEAVSEHCLAMLADLFGEVDDIKQWELEEKRAFVTLMSILRGLRSLDAYRRPQGIGDLIDVLTAQLEAAVPRTGTFGRGVFVGPVSQGRGLDLDQVWVVGLSEDLYPGRQQEDGLLPDWLRAETLGLVSVHERVGRLERALSAAFGSADRVTASFPRGDLRANTEKLPSRALLPSLRLLLGKPDLAATQWQSAPKVPTVVECASYASGIRSTGAAASDQEWSMRRVLDVGGQFDDPAFHAAREARRSRLGPEFTRFDGNLSGLAGLPDHAAGERHISPTSLELYAKCPFAYFVEKMLYVEPVMEPSVLSSIRPIDVGNIFHYTMDRFITAEKVAGMLPGLGEAWRPEHYDRLLAVAAEVIAEFEVKGLLGHPTLWGFAEPAVRAELAKMLDDDSGWRAGLGAAPVDSELSFGDGKDHPAVEIQVAGGTVRFRGSADKVDRAGDTVFITDLKSGKSDPFRKIDPKRGAANPTVNGTKLQLPVYAKAALRANQGAQAVQAQYWFVHGRSAGERVQLALTAELEQTFSETVGTLVGGIARGHFFKKPSKEPGYLWVDCEYCSPGGVGHETARRGYLQKRAHPDLLGLLTLVDPEGAKVVGEGLVEDVEEDDQ